MARAAETRNGTDYNTLEGGGEQTAGTEVSLLRLFASLHSLAL